MDVDDDSVDGVDGGSVAVKRLSNVWDVDVDGDGVGGGSGRSTSIIND